MWVLNRPKEEILSQTSNYHIFHTCYRSGYGDCATHNYDCIHLLGDWKLEKSWECVFPWSQSSSCS